MRTGVCGRIEKRKKGEKKGVRESINGTHD